MTAHPLQVQVQGQIQVQVSVVIDRPQFPQLLQAIQQQGYQLLGPTVRDSAIVYDEITSVDDLPIGWTEIQEGGTYRLVRRHDRALFGFNVGPQSWKRHFFAPHLKLWQAERQGQAIAFTPQLPETKPRALIGARSCDLHAIAIQDRVFLQGEAVDPHYQASRQDLFVVAVNCGQAGGTCFCVSMQTGPKATQGFDLALTEVLKGDRHFFVVEVGSDRGAQVLAAVPHTPVTEAEQAMAAAIVAETAQQMGRELETEGIKELLYQNLEHPRWENVASRCLACGNCTLVCPTCFCSTTEDITDLTGDHTERWRLWDSCFSLEFSHLHGGSVRTSIKSRYRQWMTHKLATWIDQFGTSGCVGCGRCITWCPVAIDLTEETRAIREDQP